MGYKKVMLFYSHSLIPPHLSRHMPICTLCCTWRYSDKMAVDTRKNHPFGLSYCEGSDRLSESADIYHQILAFFISATQNEYLKSSHLSRTMGQVACVYTVLPALRAIRSLFYHLIFSLHRWRSMKVAALFFCTHTHPCNIDMNIK